MKATVASPPYSTSNLLVNFADGQEEKRYRCPECEADGEMWNFSVAKSVFGFKTQPKLTSKPEPQMGKAWVQNGVAVGCLVMVVVVVLQDLVILKASI